MTEKEIKQAKAAIFKAIEDEDYTVSIEEPNNVEVRSHRDGSEYLYICDMDDARSSTDFGSCTVEIADFTFTNDFSEGVWSCDEEELLEEEDIIEAIEGLDGVLCGEYTSVEDQAYVFNRANGTDIDEYYWYEDSDCPADPDEMKSLDDFYWDTYDFEGETYYLVDDTINEADQEHEGKRWGIGAYGDPDDDGMFDCVILLFDDEEDTVVDIMDTDEMLNNEGELE